MNHTAIEWVHNPDGSPGYTLDPITGCLKGCTYCNAAKLARGRYRKLYLSEPEVVTRYDYRDDDRWRYTSPPHEDAFTPRRWPHRLDELDARNRRLQESRGGYSPEPRGILVGNAGELFGPWLPRLWIEDVLRAIEQNEGHDRFYLLTGHPEELLRWSPFPANCWVGVSATHDGDIGFAEAALRRVKATGKYIIVEPLLERMTGVSPVVMKGAGIDWLIIGAQTKPYIAPKVEWVRELVEVADRAGVPVFLKDSLSDIVPPNGRHEPFLRYGPAGELRLRQEMPFGHR